MLRRSLLGIRGRSASVAFAIFMTLAASGCTEQILHDLSEQDANKVLSRLSAGDMGAEKVLQSDGRWAIAVPRDKVVVALGFLDTNRVLAPRGAAGVEKSKSGFVPSREEQWFRYERSVALSIEDSLSTLQGVLEARVHLNLPETDPIFGTRKEDLGTGSVLLVIDQRYSAKDEEISALVGGAAGIPAGKVTVLRSVTPQRASGGEVIEPVQVARSASSTVVAPSAAEGVPAESVASKTSLGLKTDSWVMYADVGVASFAVLAIVGGGSWLVARRRRKVTFKLPDGKEADA